MSNKHSYLAHFFTLTLITMFMGYSDVNAQVQLGRDTIIKIDYSNPLEYEIGGVTVSGLRFLDERALITISGLEVGSKIRVPGDRIAKAIESLWKQGILDDVKIVVTEIKGENIFLELQLAEKPQLTRYKFTGVTKSEADKLREKLGLKPGNIITEALKKTTSGIVKNYFVDKGFLKATCNITTALDSITRNGEIMFINISKSSKTKINKIYIEGNSELKDIKIKRKLKDTKERHWYRLFKTSKYIESNLEEDIEAVIAKYQERGLRDANLVSHSIKDYDAKSIDLTLTVYEGPKYYFRNITWIGNTKYRSGQLDTVLNIKKGDIYNQKQLDEALYMSQSGRDIQSLYMDDGYLFFSITPVEVRVENDSIDLEMRLYEGKQATINKVYIRGNTKTNDRVVLREIRTQPGQLFNRSDVIRTVRELAQLGYFDQEKLNPSPKPNPVDGTVDIEYNVEERPSDQLQLSGGYGNNQLVGTLGLSFTNFSARNIFKGKEYTPLPAGDGQRLSIQAQSSGRNFQSYNLSFTEPWLGGKKPNAFTATIYHSRSNSFSGGSNLRLSGLTFGLGKRIRWPDDFFSLYYDIGFNIIEVVTPEGSIPTYQFENGTISNGTSNNFNLGVSLSRNSIDAPIYPRRGGSFAASVSATPPYSFFNSIDYKTASASEKFKWIEYHKWKFTSSWFTKIADNLVVAARMQYGFLGIYNRAVGASPFERFFIGGDGMTGFNFFESREIISMRGYDQNDLTPLSNRQAAGATIYTKYTMELRYPVSLNPNATIYILGFAEAGNGFLKFRDFSPFNVKRAAGAGVRIFLPMFGLLGLDWGYGFDNPYGTTQARKSGLQFTIGQQF